MDIFGVNAEELGALSSDDEQGDGRDEDDEEFEDEEGEYDDEVS